MTRGSTSLALKHDKRACEPRRACRRTRRWSWIMIRGACIALLLLPLAAPCQSRLEQLEATYQANLRALDAPILQDYLRQLELLKSQFVARNRLEDAKHVDLEIARIRNIAATTGVLPYTELEAAINASAPDKLNGSKPVPAAANGEAAPLPTLLAAEAFKGEDVNTQTGAIPLGSAEWRVFKLPKGTHDVLIVYGTLPLTAPEQLTLTIAGREFHGVIPADRATGSPEKFRLLRLCQITLDSEVNGGVLSVAASSQEAPLIWVKKIMFAAPKPPATPAAN